MGCSWSTNTAVRSLTPGDGTGTEDETGSKLDARGDSAVSKGTTDSGVVIQDGRIPELPGEVLRKPPDFTDGVFDRNRQDDMQLQSSKILEELENQGIIPVGQRGSAAGEAYSIMLDDGEAVRRRPPARLESLKATKEQSLPSRENYEEKMRRVEERRKLKENEFKTRLRAQSARVHVPVPSIIAGAEEDAGVAPMAWTDQPVSADHFDPASLSRIQREEAEGEEAEREEHARERFHDVRERSEEGGTGSPQGGSEDGSGEEEELTQVVELMNELYDSRLQSPEDKELL